MHVVLETERLLLRHLTPGDAEALFQLDADPEVMRFVNGGKPTPRAHLEAVLLPALLAEYGRAGGLGRLAAEERSSGVFLGWFGLRAPGPRPEQGERATGDALELGYRLHRAAWGHGYATEGARALVRHAFTVLGATRVWAQTMAVNVRSRRTMEKAGLRFVRSFHVEWPERIEGSDLGDVEYAIDRVRWERLVAGDTGS